MKVTPEDCCIFGNALNKMPRAMREHIASMMPHKSDSREKKESDFKNIGEYILHHAQDIFASGRRGFCFRHSHPEGCLIIQQSRRSTITISISGPTCKPFSVRGNHEKEASPHPPCTTYGLQKCGRGDPC